MKNFKFNAIFYALALVWTMGANASAMTEMEEDIALVYGDKATVSIATGNSQPISRAPAVATVITAQEIASSGATDLDQLLETVPGLHVARAMITDDPIYVIRGVATQYNQQALVMVNGIPMSTVFVGDRGNVWGGLSPKNIARIEVIRGPGSALYGADAFSGVINLITKSADDISGTEVGAQIGTFASRSASLLHGSKWGEAKVAAYLEVGKSDGSDRVLSVDAQTGLDQAFGTKASYAPGKGNFSRNSIDAQLDIGLENWRARVSYKRREGGVGFGLAQALDPAGVSASARTTADVTWNDKQLSDHWDVSVQASFFRYTQKSWLVLYPPGTFGGAFPDGMVGNPGNQERHGRLSATAGYSGIRDHNLRFGVGFEHSETYSTEESKNFTFVFVPGVGNVPVPLGKLVDVSNTAPFLRPHARQLRYAYVQDEWAFAKDWYLTAGVRHDQYSDFGGTTNPRFALVWEAAYNVTAKLLFGQAFRAPSFVEKYNINNPVALGNPDVKPETMRTYEAVLNWQPRQDVQLVANFFRYQMKDYLHFVSNDDATTGATAKNTPGQTARGVELEATWDVNKRLRLVAGYGYQDAKDETTQKSPGIGPRHHLTLRGDWRLNGEWSVNGLLNRVADRPREPDPREMRAPIADYHTVDLTVRHGTSRSPWDVSLSVRNLFNADVREPSPSPGQIPNDLPQPGRTWVLQASYRM